MTLSADFVILTAVAYVGLLFVLAYVTEVRAKGGKARFLRSPLVYTLSISVYCTSWTFYGAVGTAARDGLEFMAIYMGPTLVFVGWWYVLRKLLRIGHSQRITSIADFLSSRYGKSSSVAVFVTLIAVVTIIPYIALQLKAITTSIRVISGADGRGGMAQLSDAGLGLSIAAGMALFTILFGTRNVDAREQHQGVVAAIAFEAIVKILALMAVALYVTFGLSDGPAAIYTKAVEAGIQIHESQPFGMRWVTVLILAATAIICHRFSASILRDARGLSHSLQALARYFDQASIKRRSISPVREVEDAIIAANNHFPVLEDLADHLRLRIGERLDEASLTGYLSTHHGIRVLRADGAAPAGVLHLRSSDPMATRLFHLCQAIALRESEAILSELIAKQALSSPQAEAGARRALASYVAGAMMMPYSAYRQAAEDHGYDVDLLSHLFGCSFEQAAHRLVTLRRPTDEGVPFGFLRADGVGRLVKRFPLPGLSMPSGGYGCALWPIYQTSATRGVVRQVVEFPNGAKFLMIAKSITKRVARWSELPLSFSVLLVCDIHYASRTVYGSGLALEDSASHVPVGPACSLCPRFDCGHRQDDSVHIIPP